MNSINNSVYFLFRPYRPPLLLGIIILASWNISNCSLSFVSIFQILFQQFTVFNFLPDVARKCCISMWIRFVWIFLTIDFRRHLSIAGQFTVAISGNGQQWSDTLVVWYSTTGSLEIQAEWSQTLKENIIPHFHIVFWCGFTLIQLSSPIQLDNGSSVRRKGRNKAQGARIGWAVKVYLSHERIRRRREKPIVLSLILLR